MNLTYYRHPGSVSGRKDKLMRDLKAVVVDGDELLNEIGNSTVEEFAAARARIESRLHAARMRLDHARVAMARSATHAVDATSEYVRENPWKSVGLPAVAALVIFLVLSRR